MPNNAVNSSNKLLVRSIILPFLFWQSSCCSQWQYCLHTQSLGSHPRLNKTQAWQLGAFPWVLKTTRWTVGGGSWAAALHHAQPSVTGAAHSLLSFIHLSLPGFGVWPGVLTEALLAAQLILSWKQRYFALVCGLLWGVSFSPVSWAFAVSFESCRTSKELLFWPAWVVVVSGDFFSTFGCRSQVSGLLFHVVFICKFRCSASKCVLLPKKEYASCAGLIGTDTSKLLKGFTLLAIKIQLRQLLTALSSTSHYILWECVMVELAAGGLPCCFRSMLEASWGLQATLKKSDIMVSNNSHARSS